MAAVAQKGVAPEFEQLAGARTGLYVLVFSNEARLHVFDRNGRPRPDGTRGTLIVNRRGLSLKPGKFERGFGARMLTNLKHMHHRPRPGVQKYVMLECFKRGWLLDLASLETHVSEPARVFEAYWNLAINIFLTKNNLLADPPIVQRTRAEWRFLQRERWTDRVEDRLEKFLRQLAERIFAMAPEAALPDASGRDGAPKAP